MSRSIAQKRHGLSTKIQNKKTGEKRLALLSCAALAASAMALASSAQAQTAWTGAAAGDTTNWFNAGNWTNGVPVAGETVTFNDPSANGIATTINTSSLTPTASQLIFTNTASTVIQSGNASGSQTFLMDNGGINIDANAGAVSFGNNTTSGFNLNFNLVGNVLWQNNSTNTLSILAGPGANSIGANATASATLTIDGPGNTFIGGSLANNGSVLSLVKNGTGTLEIDGSGSTMTGGVTINNGMVLIKSSNAFNSASGATNTVTFNGGGLGGVGSTRTLGTNIAVFVNGDFSLGGGTSSAAIAINGNVDLMGGNHTLTTNNNTQFINGTISDGGLTKAGTRTLVLKSSTYSGPTVVAAGTLQATNTAAFSPNSAFSVSNGATLDTFGFAETIASLSDVNGSGGSVKIGNVAQGGLTLGGDNSSTTFSGIISGNGTTSQGGIIKVGTGTFTMAGPNTFAGPININAGAISVSSDGNLGNATNVVNLGAGSLLSTGSFTTGRTINMTDAALSTLDATAGNTLSLTGPVTATGAVNKGSNAGTVQFAQAGGYTATSDVNVLGGTLAFGDSINGVTGSVNIPGTLSVSDGATAAFLPAAGSVVTHNLNALNLNNTGKLDVGNSSFLTTTPTSTIQSYLQSGYNAGHWNGSASAAIVSSSAAAAFGTGNDRSLGYASSTDHVAGSVVIPAGQTLVKYTTPGDADLSGTTDFNDFLALQNNYNQSGNWSQGDWNYSGTVDFNDYLILQNNYNHKLNANGSASAAGSAKTAASKLTASGSVSGPATVTYVLVKNDDGSGHFAAGSFAVYAVDTTADGNQGLAAYEFDVKGFSTISNFAPAATYFSGGKALGEGFSSLRSADTGENPVKGSQDTTDANVQRIVYGFGQTAGSLDSTSGSDILLAATQQNYGAPLLLATGTFTDVNALLFNSDNTFDQSNVFLANTGTATEGATITLQTQTLSGVPEPTSLGLLALAAGGMLARRKRRK